MKRFYIDRDNFSGKELDRSVSVLREGGVIILPAETLYGFSADPANRDALLRIRRLKGREDASPFLLLAPDIETVRRYVIVPDERVEGFLGHCWPGPVSALLKAASGAPSLVIGPGGKIGVRVPPKGVASAICARLDGFVVSTSVNRSGETPLLSPGKIWKRFGADVDLMLDIGAIRRAEPSAIVDLSVNPPEILRTGMFSRREIEKKIGKYW